MLYKYLIVDRVSVLEDLEVRFSQPRALNDPFEASPLIDATLDQADFIKKIELDAEELWSTTADKEKTPGNYQLLQAQLHAAKLDIYEKNVSSKYWFRAYG
ncbi:hypothetical protein [Geotalea toluenoxydans]|uniref:hypothetical protein n=1 Tax=Geotalea toluenoxydans TaxID=421624 RepID=UPI001FB4CB21|nr:hypothetical protein [Geotalea toluenoxydans]